MRTRDRRGRGMRGHLMPPTMPGSLTRRGQFERMVAVVAAELTVSAPDMAGIHVVVEDIPVISPRWSHIPLGRIVRHTTVPQIVVHRRPVESTGHGELLVKDVLVELASQLLAKDPADLDPGYPYVVSRDEKYVRQVNK